MLSNMVTKIFPYGSISIGMSKNRLMTTNGKTAEISFQKSNNVASQSLQKKIFNVSS